MQKNYHWKKEQKWPKRLQSGKIIKALDLTDIHGEKDIQLMKVNSTDATSMEFG
jgi:hypothetical protein